MIQDELRKIADNNSDLYEDERVVLRAAAELIVELEEQVTKLQARITVLGG